MTPAFAAAAADLVRDPHLSVAAVYTPPGPAAVPVEVRAIPLGGDSLATLGDALLAGRSAAFQVRIVDLPAPQPGGVLTVGAVDWMLVSPPVADSRSLFWTLEGRRQ